MNLLIEKKPAHIYRAIGLLLSLRDNLELKQVNKFGDYNRIILQNITTMPSERVDGKLLINYLREASLPRGEKTSTHPELVQKRALEVLVDQFETAKKIYFELDNNTSLPLKAEYIQIILVLINYLNVYNGFKNGKDFFKQIEPLLPSFQKTLLAYKHGRPFVLDEACGPSQLARDVIDVIMLPNMLKEDEKKIQNRLLCQWWRSFLTREKELFDDASDIVFYTLNYNIAQNHFTSQTPEFVALFNEIEKWIPADQHDLYKMNLLYLTLKFYYNDLVKDFDRYFSILDELIKKLDPKEYIDELNGHIFDLIILNNKKYTITPEQLQKQSQIVHQWLCFLHGYLENSQKENTPHEKNQHQILFFLNNLIGSHIHETMVEHQKVFDAIDLCLSHSPFKTIKTVMQLLKLDFHGHSLAQKDKGRFIESIEFLMPDLKDVCLKLESFAYSIGFIDVIQKVPDPDQFLQKELFVEWLDMLSDAIKNVKNTGMKQSLNVHLNMLINRAHQMKIINRDSPEFKKRLDSKTIVDGNLKLRKIIYLEPGFTQNDIQKLLDEQ